MKKESFEKLLAGTSPELFAAALSNQVKENNLLADFLYRYVAFWKRMILTSAHERKAEGISFVYVASLTERRFLQKVEEAAAGPLSTSSAEWIRRFHSCYWNSVSSRAREKGYEEFIDLVPNLAEIADWSEAWSFIPFLDIAKPIMTGKKFAPAGYVPQTTSIMSNLDSHVGKFIENAVDLCISGKTDEVKVDKIDLDPVEAERKFPSYYIEGFILNFDEKQRYSESDEEAGVKQNSDKPAIKTESNNNETAAKELHLEAEQHEQVKSLNSDGDKKTERKTAGLAVPYELRSKYTTPMTPAQVKKLFSDAGFEVIDKTSKGGCIWIIANPENDDDVNKLALKSGRWFRLAQNGGRSTNYRRAYFWMPRKKSGRR